MRLNNVKDNPGARKVRVRIGRGIGSGMGKMGGRGGKGQTARSGVAIGGFEGGQMPLHRRLPKRGFNKLNPKHWNEVNLGRLQQAVEAGAIDGKAEIDVKALVAAGVVRRELDGLRILGDGELKSALKVKANHVSLLAVNQLQIGDYRVRVGEHHQSWFDLDPFPGQARIAKPPGVHNLEGLRQSRPCCPQE